MHRTPTYLYRKIFPNKDFIVVSRSFKLNLMWTVHTLANIYIYKVNKAFRAQVTVKLRTYAAAWWSIVHSCACFYDERPLML